MTTPPDAATWTALADPHRRAMLGLLRQRPRAVGELVDALELSQPSTSKHLRVLREAGLVRVRAQAQRRVYEVDPEPLVALDAWLAPYRRLWSDSLDALGRRLDGTAVEDPAHEPSEDTP
ncbi:ArsR/SmtB family transcription factor [Actinomycetospora cinnamomea]|uniref:ArsR family transcriptional regulator n=1 Tax=Actinomycetospora cinnamomea TaxID=663609 RepID=A0A2U1FJ55_9PSEU|nr:metalloregulator ArsR/SmtB family transcription factor [Actinomycetospora cinnamomea]PVZ12030.1 ArsR family transcriptional regulator [Actinomycetospora cinnamomea]